MRFHSFFGGKGDFRGKGSGKGQNYGKGSGMSAGGFFGGKGGSQGKGSRKGPVFRGEGSRKKERDENVHGNRRG